MEQLTPEQIQAINIDVPYVLIGGNEEGLINIIMLNPDHFNYVDSRGLTQTCQLWKPFDELTRQATKEEIEANKRLS